MFKYWFLVRCCLVSLSLLLALCSASLLLALCLASLLLALSLASSLSHKILQTDVRSDLRIDA